MTPGPRPIVVYIRRVPYHIQYGADHEVDTNCREVANLDTEKCEICIVARRDTPEQVVFERLMHEVGHALRGRYTQHKCECDDGEVALDCNSYAWADFMAENPEVLRYVLGVFGYGMLWKEPGDG